jgi:DNA-directed RNA polymerase specialized sigma24 family protein
LQEADALDAIQMTWLRLAENADRIQFPERLGGWLATTARRECLQILRDVKREPHHTDVVPEPVSDPSATLRKLIDELSLRRRALIRMLFTDDPSSDDKIARIAGIPLRGIGPARARVLQQLREQRGLEA